MWLAYAVQAYSITSSQEPRPSIRQAPTLLGQLAASGSSSTEIRQLGQLAASGSSDSSSSDTVKTISCIGRNPTHPAHLLHQPRLSTDIRHSQDR